MSPKPVLLAAAALLGCADLANIEDWDPSSRSASTSAGAGGAGGGVGGSGTGAAASSGPTTSSSASGPGGGPATYAAEVLLDAPLEYWPLDEDGGTTAASIAVGDPHNGIYSGAVQLGGVPLVKGSMHSARFTTSVTDNVTIGDVRDFAGKSPFTLEAWVKVSTGANYRSPLMKHDGTNGWIFWVNENNFVYLRRSLLGNGAGPDGVGPALVPGAVYHLVATYDGSTSCIYINGVQTCVEDMYSIENISAVLYLGAGLDGELDEVAIYSDPLGPARIEAHYEAGKLP